MKAATCGLAIGLLVGLCAPAGAARGSPAEISSFRFFTLEDRAHQEYEFVKIKVKLRTDFPESIKMHVFALLREHDQVTVLTNAPKPVSIDVEKEGSYEIFFMIQPWDLKKYGRLDNFRVELWYKDRPLAVEMKRARRRKEPKWWEVEKPGVRVRRGETMYGLLQRERWKEDEEE